jgi:hypothetical protein
MVASIDLHAFLLFSGWGAVRWLAEFRPTATAVICEIAK